MLQSSQHWVSLAFVARGETENLRNTLEVWKLKHVSELSKLEMLFNIPYGAFLSPLLSPVCRCRLAQCFVASPEIYSHSHTCPTCFSLCASCVLCCQGLVLQLAQHKPGYIKAITHTQTFITKHKNPILDRSLWSNQAAGPAIWRRVPEIGK